MGASLRKSVIEIDWKINNSSLQQANRETDQMISRAGQMEKKFDESKRAIDGTTQAVKGSNASLSQVSQTVQEFGVKSERAYRKTENGATSAKEKTRSVSDAYKQSASSAEKMGNETKAAGVKSEGAMAGASEKVKRLDNDFDKLDGSVESFASKSTQRFNALKSVVIGFATGAVVSVAKKTFDLASDTNESMNKVDVAFGDSADNVKAWSKTTLDNIGLAQGTALDLAATYGDMSTSMGLSDAEAQKMSTSMVNLAGDLASFKNIGIDRANTALNGVFTGETEALKGLGIVMTQTNLEQFAMESGAVKTAKSGAEVTKQNIAREKAQKKLNEAIKEHGKNSLEARDAQAKLQEIQEKANKSSKVNLSNLSQEELVRLRYNYVMSRTKNAQGDFARTSDQAANASRVFSESLKEIGSNAGQYLLPMITPLITKASDFSKKFSDIPRVADNLKKKYPEIVSAGEDVVDFFKNDLIPGAKAVAENLGAGALEGGAASLKVIGGVLKTTVLPPLKAVTGFAKDNPDSMKRIAKYATIGATAFFGFKLVKGIIDKTVGSIDRLLMKVKLIGPETAVSASESAAAIQAIDTSASVSGGTVGKTTKGTSILGKIRGSTKFGKIGASVSKLGKFGKLAGGAAGLNVLMSATELIGMNNKNAGSKIGGFGGSVGGMAGGAAIGTAIAPGIGTAIGGAIGAFAGSSLGKSLGSYLQKEGPKMFDKLKSGWKGLSNWAEKHPLLGSSINAANKFGSAVKKNWKASVAIIKAGAKETKDFFADPLKVDVSGKGISNSSAKAMNKYLKNEQKLINQRTDILATGREMTEKELKSSISTYDKMADQLLSATDKKTAKANKDWDKLVKAGIISDKDAKGMKADNVKTGNVDKKDIKKNNQELIRLEKEHYHDQQVITENAEEKINAIKAKAKKKNRAVTKEEQKEIERIENNANQFRSASQKEYSAKVSRIEKRQQSEAITALSKSSREQKIIFGNLQDSKGKMSAKAAAKVVKSSAKARNGSIKEARKEYRDTKKILDEKRFVTGEISEKEYKDLIKKAKKKRDGQIGAAEETHKKTVEEAQKQAKGHKKQVDWETGETLSKWDQFKNGFMAKTAEITGGVAQKWMSFGNGFVNVARSVKDSAVNVWNSLKTNIFGIINSAITGINKVLSFFKLGLIPLIGNGKVGASQENKLSTKEKKKYHSTSQSGNLAMNFTGSNSASGQIMAGEGGFEIAYNKNSAKARILGANGPEITHVEPGTKILNHSDSKKMMSGGIGSGKVLPGFAKGNTSILGAVSDMAGKAVDTAKDIGGKVADGFDKALEFASDPIKSVKKLLLKRSGIDSKTGSGKLANGMIDHFGSKAGEWLKDKIGDMAMVVGGGPAGPSGKGAKAWAPIIKQAALAMKVDLSASELAGIMSQIHRESGGNQSIVQSSAVVDVNTLSGNPARGLLQYIPSTFKAYAVNGHGNINSGYDQLLAFFNNSTWRNDLPYGKSGWGPHGKRRFEKGGRPPVKETVLVGEKGPELFETDTPGRIHTAQQTQQLLNKRSGNGGTTINFDPTININVEGGNAETNSIASAVKAEMEKLFEKLVTVYKPEGV